MFTYLSLFTDHLRDRWRELHRDAEAGYSTETVVVTALLVALAIAVLAVLTVAVMNRATSIDLGA
ncbi:hypothetical protein FHR81_003245 [Actinoalloteichus hoggarensis]|uniref:Uncharacterized protein n=1 Tax=Actinoalloteichus hoggarensis TaxID=1470176 RepID=A0A221W7B9_9PSEU|nr:hypothetical protein [Actinoalloteichus hoggarensis]ASO21601.1 hypothetical protein AHOG_19915 [Actinoalloteichus hoggarensis]MBB5922193.1 hypothetical protein [Actinoalloteichus hoggarensis]